MKKLLVILLAVCLLAVCAVSVNAADATGQCGDNLTWTLSGNTLTISGTGPMYDYSEETPAPWASLIPTTLNKVVIEEGVTTIGSYAFRFQDASIYVDAIIASSVTYVGDRAFRILKNNHKIDYFLLGDAPEIGEYPFGSLNNIYVVNWDDAAKKSIGVSEVYVKDATIQLDALNSNQLVGLNEALKPEDFTFGLYDQLYVTDYTPRQLSFSAYDNSTYGQKSVTVTADGFEFEFTYFVTDGSNHLDLIKVEFSEIPEYTGRRISLHPTVTMGSMKLVEEDHYDLDITGAFIGTDGRVTVTGKGITKGFEKTFYYPILKKDITDSYVYAHSQAYTGMPLHTHFGVQEVSAQEDDAYQTLYENNINVGYGIVRAVGKGNHCGEARGTFHISLQGQIVSLPGEYIGTVDGELSDDIPYYEQTVLPGSISGRVECSVNHIAAYALYSVGEEEVTLIEEYVSSAGHNQITHFKYDFSSVYEDAVDTGGAVYLLSYMWITEKEEVYAGIMAMIIPAKTPDATSMTMEHVENDGDFRKEFFTLCSDDGALGAITWESSNPSVATVENGTVTLKKPGTATISGQYGDMVETYVLTAPQLDLTEGIIFDYSEENGARVIYDNRLLTQGTDYILSVTKDGDAVTVTATGCGLFAGELMKTFDGLDSLADPHTHSFDNSCDGTCNGCDFTRSNDHNFAETWTKNETHHWHACTACGEKADQAQHSLSAGDETVCNICGPLYTPGDLTGDYSVNEDDAIYLLQHILLPDFFTVNQAVDYTGDNRVDEDDAIYLLQHVLLPEFFPL